ncbi:MAG TPA: 2-phospho-L-lactate transferase [Stellaceae bacterium]|nr:2-phospho-L-lactate transferase [Stellaceae bacterium]
MSVLALSGGIGGAKLALGLYRILPPGALTVVANTGDDFDHLGLSISPDIDTLLYTLAGLDNPETGWGRRGETWTFMAALETLGGKTWFKLGDGDLATHVERTRRLAAGETLSWITDDFRDRLGISALVLPMSNDRVQTRLRTEEGWLDFQDYFVRRRAEPVVSEIAYAGAAEARGNPDILAALATDDLEAVVICPSNPFLSIDPILSLPGVREALRACRAPVIAVSPIIGGKAVKGPTAKIMAELGLPIGAAEVARHYEDILDFFIADEADAREVERLGIPVTLSKTLMLTIEDREALAKAVLAAAGRGF